MSGSKSVSSSLTANSYITNERSPGGSLYTSKEMGFKNGSPDGQSIDQSQSKEEEEAKRAAMESKDVEELDDEGWRFASRDGRIVEMSSLGEGAGGAVTKCKLKSGKTLFALKVRASCTTKPAKMLTCFNIVNIDNHNGSESRHKAPDSPRARIQPRLQLTIYLSILWCLLR